MFTTGGSSLVSIIGQRLVVKEDGSIVTPDSYKADSTDPGADIFSI